MNKFFALIVAVGVAFGTSTARADEKPAPPKKVWRVSLSPGYIVSPKWDTGVPHLFLGGEIERKLGDSVRVAAWGENGGKAGVKVSVEF